MSDIFDNLQGTRSINEVRDVFRSELAGMGFTASACGAFMPAKNGPVPHFFYADWPESWWNLYRERNFVAYDYSIAEARQRITPFTWIESKNWRTLSQGERDLWETVNAWGWIDGYSVPIHGPAGYFGLVTMASTDPIVSHTVRRHLHALAILVHDRCRALTAIDPVNGPNSPLTARELECLRWVAAGKTDPEISTIMSISATTIKGHIDGARRKLDARTRAHAVLRMVLCGLA